MAVLSSLLKPLAYVSLPAILIHAASRQSSLVRYYVRLGFYLSAIGICSVWGVLVSIGFTLIGRRFDINYIVAGTFEVIAGRTMGIHFDVEGEEYLQEPAAVIMCNHQSMLDILFIGRCVLNTASI